MHAIYINTIQTTWWTTLAYLMHYLHEYDFANWLPQGFAQYHTQVQHLIKYPWDFVHQVSSACRWCQHQWSQWSLPSKLSTPPPVLRRIPGRWDPARSKAGWHSILRSWSWQYMTWFSMKFEIPYVQKFYIFLLPKATCAQVWCFNMHGGHVQLHEWVLLEIRKVRPKCNKDAYPDKRLSFSIKACDCRIIYFSAMQTQIGNI